MKGLWSAFKQACVQAFRNRAMLVASLFSITAMLMILGIFFVIAVNINMLTENAKSEFDLIQIYLEDDVVADDINRMQNTFAAMDEVESVEFISKEQGMEELKVKWGDNAYLLEGLTNNPLPNSIRIRVNDLEGANKVVEEAKKADGVEDIKYYKETVEKLIAVTDGIQLAAVVIICFLVLVSVIVVSNTIRLTVFARSVEIEIMKYVGATNWYIRMPFLFEGMIIGFISATVSSGLIALVYGKLVGYLGTQAIVMFGVSLVPVDFLVRNLVIVFMALGVSIGATGSIISMRRFLDNKDRA